MPNPVRRGDLALARVVLSSTGLLAAFGCGGGGSSASPVPSTLPTPTPTPAVAVTVAIAANARDMSFLPNPVVARVGEGITFRNDHNEVHHLVGDRNEFDTLGIAPSATGRSFSIGSAGTYPYHCQIHPSMVGTVTITP